MRETIVFLLIVPCLFAHDPEKEHLEWAQYYRMGAVYSETSTTGIAGPTGGSIKKPVGLIYIGIKYKNEVNVLEKNFSGSREQIQKKTIKTIFKLIDELI